MARRTSSDGFLFKGGAFLLLSTLAYWLFSQFSGAEGVAVEPAPGQGREKAVCQVPDKAMPGGGGGQLVRHTWYVLSYAEAHEQAEWVCYLLDRERLALPWKERPQGFRPDPMVSTGSATPRDYSGSGFDRGHLCPAADMAFDSLAIDETFFMSNISPQLSAFNAGVWQELERKVRRWAKKHGSLYVVAGPVLRLEDRQHIGPNQVTVPGAFYKVLLSGDLQHAIGFVVPHERTNASCLQFAVTVDQVEELTGLDFFPQLLEDREEAWLESALDKGAWR